MFDESLISQVIRSRRRTLGLEITSDARLIIRAPMRVSYDSIRQIVQKKLSWILEKQKRARERSQGVLKRQFIEGEEFLYLGNSYKLCVSITAHRPFEFTEKEFIFSSSSILKAKVLLIQWYTKEAIRIIPFRVKHYCQVLGVDYSRITITHATTRWGSCSSSKRLNFTWRLMMTPLEMVDYVVAHEVAHLRELNHSSQFWSTLASIMPDYQQRQRWFRDNQNSLSKYF